MLGLHKEYFETLAKNLESYNNVDIHIVEDAFVYAAKIHKNQKRKSGEPYIMHPVAVANIVYEIGGDEDLIVASLLHDTVEDGDNPEQIKQDIQNLFGASVLFLVLGLSKDTTLSSDEAQNEFFVRIRNLSKQNLGILFVKIADILHNLSSITNLKPAKQKKWINELTQGYIPMLSDVYEDMSISYKKMYDRIIDKLAIELENYYIKV